MKHENPYNRLLLNTTLVLIFSPLYLVVLATPGFGVVNRLAGNIAAGNAFAQPLLYVFLLGFIVSVGWLFVRGRIAGPMGLFFLLLLTYGFVSGTDKEKRYELLIGAGRPTLGVDVYCNGVNLGKTPVRISKEELYKEVKPWDRPPRQIRFDMQGADHTDDRYFWAKYYYVPNDVFDRWNEWPPDHNRYNRHNLTETLKDIEATRYWWHFEKDGCVGLAPIANFGGGGGGGRVITIGATPQITFLSAGPHLTALLDELARSEYAASDEWIAYFRKYSGLLFMDFYNKAQANDKLQPSLGAVVRAEFNIPKEPTRADCARVVDEILDRVEKNGCFTAPSLESVAMDIVGKVDRRPIVKRFREYLDMPPGSGIGGTASSTGWTTWRRSGKAARQLPLEYAVRNLRPPELFNRLVYLSTNSDRFLDVVGNYRRPEAVRLISHHLRQIERGKERGHVRRFNVQDAIGLCSKIDNPELDELFYWFIRENANSRTHYIRLRRFFESRVKSKESDKSLLAEFVYSSAPLGERDKIEQLCKIDSPTSLNYINHFTRFDDRQRKRVLGHLRETRNPSLDDFLIESYNWLVGKPDVKYYGNHAVVTWALLNANSDRIRKFLESKWNESAESRGKLIKILASAGWTKPHMAWLVPLIAQLPPDEKYEAAGILDSINTDDAWALLEEWADGDNEKLAGQAKWRLDKRAKETKNLKPLAGKGAELIAGKIKPDDLLADATAYVWTDKGYIPEKELSKKPDKESDAR